MRVSALLRTHPAVLRRRLAASVVALTLGVASATAVGCGGSDESTAPTVPSVGTEQTVSTDTVGTAPGDATTTAPPPAATAAPRTSTTSGGAVAPPPVQPAPSGGGAAPTTTTTPATPKQDPDCKPGTGRGFPDKPQCEPVSGPDAQDEG